LESVQRRARRPLRSFGHLPIAPVQMPSVHPRSASVQSTQAPSSLLELRVVRVGVEHGAPGRGVGLPEVAHVPDLLYRVGPTRKIEDLIGLRRVRLWLRGDDRLGQLDLILQLDVGSHHRFKLNFTRPYPGRLPNQVLIGNHLRRRARRASAEAADTVSDVETVAVRRHGDVDARTAAAKDCPGGLFDICGILRQRLELANIGHRKHEIGADVDVELEPWERGGERILNGSRERHALRGIVHDVLGL
jgi:hypothetical protein